MSDIEQEFRFRRLLILDANGLVVTATTTNVAIEGAVEVDEETYQSAEANVGKVKWVDGDLVPIPPAPVDLAAYAAQRRWEIETGGITFNGIPVSTDDRSKIMIAGARTKAKEDPSTEKRWKGASGSFVTLDAASLIAIGDAVEAHVQACFDAEANVLALIEAGEITTPEGVDAGLTIIPATY